MKELKVNLSDKILIIAPHPDDESIGCGSLLLDYSNQIDILVITDGKNGCRLSCDYVKKNIVSIRSVELNNAMRYARVNSVKELGLPDGSSYFMKNRINIDTTLYTMIFVPNRFETHLDHMYLFDQIYRAKRRQHSNCKIYEYEIWTPLRKPNYYYDCGNDYTRKLELISHYSSQLAEYDYISIAKGLNMYRGAKLKRQFCEAFYSIESSPIEKVFNLLPNSIKIYLRESKARNKLPD